MFAVNELTALKYTSIPKRAVKHTKRHQQLLYINHSAHIQTEAVMQMQVEH